MKNSKIVTVLMIFWFITIACALLIPTVTPTPKVIYKSPDDMNLQPGDVPGLEEAPIGYKETETYLPNSEGESRRAYRDNKRDIYVETLVILVTDPAEYSFDKIYEIIMGISRPNSHRTGGDKEVNLGERAYLIPFSDEGCGQGLMLIIIRSNVVMIITACGDNVDEDYMITIGEIMDKHVQDPPDETTIPTEPPGFTGKDQCLELNLTPEECANVGTHTYGVQNIKMLGNCQPVENFTCAISHNFTEGGVNQKSSCTFFDGYQSSGSVFFTRIGENQYTNSQQIETSTAVSTLVYTLDGLTVQTISTYEGGETCESDYVYTRQ